MFTPKMAGKTLASLSLVAVLVGCSSSNVVDGKDVIPVPVPPVTVSGSPSPQPSATCYLLEVERVVNGEEMEGDNYACVSKEEWDANHVDEEWVDVNGNKMGDK